MASRGAEPVPETARASDGTLPLGPVAVAGAELIPPELLAPPEHGRWGLPPDSGRWIAPIVSFLLTITVWQAVVVLFRLPVFVLPPPLAVAQAFVANFG